MNIMNINILGPSRSGHNFIKDNLKSWTLEKIKDIENPINRLGGNDINIICIRDYLNNIASLAKLRINHIDRSIKSWIFLAKESFDLSNTINNKYIIFYEKFRNSESYRREICKIIKGSYNEGRLKELPQGGMISSFYGDNNDGKTREEKYKIHIEKFSGNADKMETTTRWKQILKNEEDKEYFISKLKQYPEAIEIYVEYYPPNEEQLQFLKKYNIYNTSEPKE